MIAFQKALSRARYVSGILMNSRTVLRASMMRRYLGANILAFIVTLFFTTPVFALEAEECQGFVSKLDLSLSDLSAVKYEYEAGNYVAACQTYFDYFRTKDTSSPLLNIDYTVEKDSDRNTDSADQQVDDGIFEVAGKIYDVNENGGVFDWKNAPLTHATRFLYFAPVFDTYYHTGGDKYAKHIMHHIRTYVDAYPIDDVTDPWANYSAVDDDLIETNVVDPWNWNVVGKRLQQFCEVINLIKTSPAVTDDDLFMVLDRLSVEILYIERETEKWVEKRPEHNGTSSMIFGLTSAGMMLEDFFSAPDWRDSYLSHTVKILDAYFYDDGTCRELVTSYCSSGADNIQRLVYALREEDAVIERKEKISNTVRAVIGLSNSGAGRRLPSYGDLFAGRVKAYLYEKAAIDWLNVDGADYILNGTGAPPTYTTWPLPGESVWGGYYTMRSGWNKEALYMAVDGGPWGTNHRHGDKLSIVVSAFDHRFVVDPSSTRYRIPDESKQNAGFLHNGLVIDGVDVFKTAAVPEESTEPLENTWESGNGYTLFRGSYSFSPLKAVNWERRIIFVDESYWLIEDVLTGSGTVSVEQNFQLNKDIVASFDDTGTRTNATAEDGSMLAIIPQTGGLLPTKSIGDSEPHTTYWPDGVQTQYPHGRGWVGESSSAKQEATAVTYKGSVTLPITLTTLLVPLDSGDSVPEVCSTLSGDVRSWTLPMPETGGSLIYNSGPFAVSFPTPCSADIEPDGDVDGADLSDFATYFDSDGLAEVAGVYGSENSGAALLSFQRKNDRQ